MEYRRSEIRAGIFLLVAFAILVVMVFAVSDIQSLFRQKMRIKAVFASGDGIEKNAPVRFSGMKIGKVDTVRVAPELGDKIELTLAVYSDATIKRDTKASIKSLGLVGGKYVELSGGSPQSPTLKADETLQGEDSLKLEDLTKAALEVVARLKNIAVNLDDILGDPATAHALRVSVKNFQQVMDSVKSTAHNLEGISASIKGMTGESGDVAKVLKELPGIVKKLDESMVNLKAASEKADKVLGDNKQNIDKTLENVEGLTRNLKDTSEDVKSNPWKLLRKP